MRFNFKKITQLLMLTGVLSNTSLVHNGVEAMEVPMRDYPTSSTYHRGMAENFINSGQLSQALFAGAYFYVGDEKDGIARNLEIARIYFEAGATINSDISNFFLKKIEKEHNCFSKICILEDNIKEVFRGAAVNKFMHQVGLAYAYHKGDGVLKDSESALFWAKKAASHKILGNLENDLKTLEYQAAAQYLVAIIYDHGEGVDCDPQMAFEYYKLAGENPCATPKMQYNLGLKYLHGDGIEFNFDLGLKYLEAAKDKGHEGALAKTISFDLTKKALTSVHRAKVKNNTAYLLSLGKSNYEKFNSLFNELKITKEKNISEKEESRISDCAILLIYSVECENMIGKIMKETITKADKFPGMDDQIFNRFKMYLFECMLTFEKLKEIIKNEETTEQPSVVIQDTDGTKGKGQDSVVTSNQGSRNNRSSEDKGKNINVNNTISHSRTYNHDNKNLLDVSANSTESLKKKATEKKVELIQKNATKKSAQKKLNQSKQELNRSKQELRQSEQELTVKQLSRTELVRKQIETARELETLKEQIKDLANSSYEIDTIHSINNSKSNEPKSNQYSSGDSKINSSPKNYDFIEVKAGNMTQETFLKNTQAEKVEQKEVINHQENMDLGYHKPEKKETVVRTLKTKIKKYNDNREEKRKIRDEKKELKRTRKQSTLSSATNEKSTGLSVNDGSVISNSVSQTMEESSFSATENESQFSITEVSEAEKILPLEQTIICNEMKKSYPKLFRILNKRDASCLNLIKLKSSTIIYDTLLNMCQQDKVCGSWDGKNIHVQKKHYQDIVFNAHTTHGSSGYDKWYHNPEIIGKFITFLADCDDTIKAYCLWKFGENCFSRLSDDSAEAGNTSKPE